LFCQKYRFAHSTLSKFIHKGDIALHQFSDAARPKVNVAEALQVMSALKRHTRTQHCVLFGMTSLLLIDRRSQICLRK
jgi:hypothetical protein